MAKPKNESKSADKVAQKIDKVADKFMDKTDKLADKLQDKMDKAKPDAEEKVVDKFLDKLDTKFDKFVDKTENIVSKDGQNIADDQDVAWYQYGGDAVAVGEDTFTLMETSGNISGNGPVTTAKIIVKATAVAEGDFTFASADTWIDSNADISVLNFREGSFSEDGVSYDVSYAVYKSVYLPAHVNLPGGPKNKVIVIDHDKDLDLDIELDGNVATVTFDVEVSGDDTLATVDAHALAIEDRLSESAVLIEAAVG